MGWSIVPAGADKRALILWKELQTRQPTEAEVAAWQHELNPAMWGVITGAISQRITLDYDGRSGRETLQQIQDFVGCQHGVELQPHRRTPSGGYHVDFRYPGWHVSTFNGKAKPAIAEKWSGTDIRADGGYAGFHGEAEAVDPATGKKKRGHYEWLRDPEPYSLDLLPLDLRAFFGLLFPPQAAERETVAAPQTFHHEQRKAAPAHNGTSGSGRVASERLVHMALERIAFEGRNDAGFWLGLQARDNGYTESETEGLLEDFATSCPETNTKGERELYTSAERRATLRQVFSRSARDAWPSSVPPSQNSHPEQSFPNNQGGPNDQSKPDLQLAAATTGNSAESKTVTAATELPTICISHRDPIELLCQCLAALQNGPCPIYGHGFDLVRIARTAEKDRLGQRTILRPMMPADVTVALAESAHFEAVVKETVKTARPPRTTAVDILHYGADRWGFPIVNAIVETPAFLADGRILAQPGHDAASQLYYAGPELSDIPDQPTQKDAIASAQYLDEHLLSDFPVAANDKTSHANLFAGMFSPVVRQAFQGLVPMCGIRAPQLACGKTLIAHLTSIVSSGYHAATTKMPADDAELNKLIVSVLRQNPGGILVFDNCVGAIGSPVLDMLLTSQFYRSRLLGMNEEVTLCQMLSVYVTGNAIYAFGDTARRIYWVSLQPDEAPTFTGRQYKHEHIDVWALEHRLELLRHFLIMCRAWHIAGRPSPKRVPRIQSFEAWSELLGGILEFAGIEGFLATFQDDADAALEQSDWAGFLVQLHGAQGETEFTAGQLVSHLRADENVHYKPVREAAPKAVLEVLDEGRVTAKLIGGLLREQCERIHRVRDDEQNCCFDFKLILSVASRGGVRVFRVLRREQGRAWPFQANAKGVGS
jgi:hypothetical protein